MFIRLLLPLTLRCRSLSTTAYTNVNRAVVYSGNGPPSSVVHAMSYPALPSPSPGTLNLRMLLAPVNPADINVIEGVYPSKPSPSTFPASPDSGMPLYVGGNEGVAEVQALGSGTESSGIQVGDWVILTRPQSGTWSTSRNVGIQSVLKVPRRKGLTVVHAATMTVRILMDFMVHSTAVWCR